MFKRDSLFTRLFLFLPRRALRRLQRGNELGDRLRAGSLDRLHRTGDSLTHTGADIGRKFARQGSDSLHLKRLRRILSRQQVKQRRTESINVYLRREMVDFSILLHRSVAFRGTFGHEV